MAIPLADKFALFEEHWSPKIIAQVNDFQVKAVKLHGEFVWHAHAETDELFFVHKGELNIQSATATTSCAPASCSSCRRVSSTAR